MIVHKTWKNTILEASLSMITPTSDKNLTMAKGTSAGHLPKKESALETTIGAVLIAWISSSETKVKA